MDYLHNFEYKANRYYSTRGNKNGNFIVWNCDKESLIFILNLVNQRLNVTVILW